jgi:hypothetical protein
MYKIVTYDKQIPGLQPTALPAGVYDSFEIKFLKPFKFLAI